MADDGKSPEGAPAGSPAGSEPKYTEEQWRGLQSSLTKKYEEARKAADEAAKRTRELEDRMEELEVARKPAEGGKPDAPAPDTRLSDLRRERELKRREEAIAAATLDVERKRLAIEHNLTPESIEGTNVAELKASALEQVLARERAKKPEGSKPSGEPLDRGNGSAPMNAMSDLERAALIVSQARKPRS